MKHVVVLFFIVIYITSCKGQNNNLSIIQQIDRDALPQKTTDVYKSFTKKELPLIYRLGGITYKPYLLNGEIMKIELIFDGDRETLIKSYYFNQNDSVFYIRHRYSFYNPPKWEKNSKELSSTESSYIIRNDSLWKPVGKNIIESHTINSEIVKLKIIKSEIDNTPNGNITKKEW